VDTVRPEASFGTRLWSRVVDPTLLTLPIVVPVFWIGRRLDLIADTPMWAICILLVGSFLATCIATALWGDSHDGWQLWARITVITFGITAVMYAIGWGPMLAIGLVFGAVDSIRLSGSRAAVPSIAMSIAALTLGELAIAAGLAPTLVDQPLVHGLAALAALGVAFTIKQFERATIGTERVEDELRQHEQHFRALVQHASDIIMVIGPDALIRYVSPAFEAILGYSSDEVVGMSGLEVAHPDDVDVLRRAIVEQARQPRSDRAEARLRERNGSWRWFEVIITDLNADPSVGGWVANMRDVTGRKAQEAALNEAQEVFRHAFDDAPIGIGLVGLDGCIQRANRSMGVLLGRTQDELVGMSISDLTHPDDRAESSQLRQQLSQNEIDFYRIEKRYVRPDSSTVWASLSVSIVRDMEGQPLYQIGQLEDITDRKVLADRLAFDAAHDAMTGLLNRSSFTERVSDALAQRGERALAVLFVDIDHFKRVNDSLGHAVGDDLVITVAQRLRASMRSDNVIARFGGDEFVVLCPDIAHADGASAIARRLLDALAEPIALGDDEVFVTASIGIAIASDGATPETLLRHADAAMYRAKNGGRARFVVFEPEDQGAAVAALRTGSELHRALARDELVLHYQPIVALRTGRVIGFESLIRWHHPERGLLAPGEFIPLAEETGLIVPIGAWAVDTACRQLVHWQAVRDAQDKRGKLSMNVNMSPRQLADTTLVKSIARILDDTGVNPNVVCLELTENALMENAAIAIDGLQRLRALGVHISIDDFGTGYSSLSYLKQFPVSALKIDRSFIEGLGRTTEDTSIVEAIVTLAHALGLTAVAEGLERPEQLEALRVIGCDYAQGFLLGRPLPAAEIGDNPADDLTLWHPDAHPTA
jgi:diguanylate cyclase (GGDEF)-like protein/PAS domain S-box-containing protein